MKSDVTILLERAGAGDAAAAEEILPLVYDELRRLARSYLQGERPDHTLQPTALVHEAYIRLVDWKKADWQSRGHFFSVAAQLMRNILVDHARKKNAEKHGGGLQRIDLDDSSGFSSDAGVDLLDLDEALNELVKLDERHAKMVELRFFAGLTLEQTAEALGVSSATVSRDWNFVRAWLYKRLKK